MNNYEAWNINPWDYPEKGTIEEKIKYFSKYGILAANIHNTQPWKLKVKDNTLDILPDWERKLSQLDPIGKNIYISIGCFVKNIEVAAAMHGFKCSITLPPKSGQIIIDFKKGKDTKLARLAPYIVKRYSNRLPYSGEHVSDSVIQELKVTDPNTRLYFSSSKTSIAKASKLYTDSVKVLASKADITQEIAKWIRPNHTHVPDGMPGFVQGFTPGQTKIAKLVMGILPASVGAKIITSADDKKMKSSPLMSILVNSGRSRSDWINIGRAYQELSLLCFSKNICITPMHSIVEVPHTNAALATIFGLKERQRPQMFFRMGYASNHPYHTPRRSLEQVLDSETNLIGSIDADIEVNTIKVGSFDINYIKAGSGKPLVMVHGGNIGWGQFYPNIKEFSQKFTVYALDMPGGGRSTRLDFKEMDFEKDQVQIFEQFVKRLGLKKPNLLGTSIGGWIVLRAAIRNSTHYGKLIVAGPVGLSNYQSKQSKIMGIYPLTKMLTKSLFKPSWQNANLEMLIRSTFYNPNLNLSRDFINYFYETTLTSHNALYISRMIGATNDLLITHKLSKIKNKTLVIWGEKDNLIPFEKNRQGIEMLPNAEVKVIKNAGHVVSIEKAKEFNMATLDFLK